MSCMPTVSYASVVAVAPGRQAEGGTPIILELCRLTSAPVRFRVAHGGLPGIEIGAGVDEDIQAGCCVAGGGTGSGRGSTPDLGAAYVGSCLRRRPESSAGCDDRPGGDREG